VSSHLSSCSRSELTSAFESQWLREWGVDIASGRPIELMKLVMREWKTGKILNQYSLEDYEKNWGNVSSSRPRRAAPSILRTKLTFPLALK
jgi:hypothetical protein